MTEHHVNVVLDTDDFGNTLNVKSIASIIWKIHLGLFWRRAIFN